MGRGSAWGWQPAVLALLLSGCAAPPVLSLAGRSCDAAPRLVATRSVALGDSATIVLDASSPCVETATGRASYAVFALPPAEKPYRITVRSQPRADALILPDAAIYAAADRPRRSMGEFRPAAGTLVASAIGEQGDRFLVVTSTPGSIGEVRDITTAANTAAFRIAVLVFIPVAVPPRPTGPTTNSLSLKLAHSGSITVTASPFTTVP